VDQRENGVTPRDRGRIYLSPPHVGDAERTRLLAALDSGWVAPLGPDVDAFEQEVAAASGRRCGAATNSGTAALHLALRLLGVGPGDEVLMPSLTFVATANAAVYLGARPVFVDVSPETWTIDPRLVAEELSARAARGALPAAVVAVDLYGQCADYDALTAVCGEYDVPLVVDAAESLGATYRERPAGSAGVTAVFSFNGNKIITTSGGGMLVGDDEAAIARARALAAQARMPVAHYEHEELGYNYRLSNVLAALGRAQLEALPERLARRRGINTEYRKQLGDLPGLEFMPVADYGEPSHWLTVVQLDPASTRCGPEALRLALEQSDVEARPTWKPLHLQPLFACAAPRALPVSERIFAHGLCLPSGSGLTDEEQRRVVALVRAALDQTS
jgi:dTDP-4-amino-4,6-dideoxygalactose transaminase